MMVRAVDGRRACTPGGSIDQAAMGHPRGLESPAALPRRATGEDTLVQPLAARFEKIKRGFFFFIFKKN